MVLFLSIAQDPLLLLFFLGNRNFKEPLNDMNDEQSELYSTQQMDLYINSPVCHFKNSVRLVELLKTRRIFWIHRSNSTNKSIGQSGAYPTISIKILPFKYGSAFAGAKPSSID